MKNIETEPQKNADEVRTGIYQNIIKYYCYSMAGYSVILLLYLLIAYLFLDMFNCFGVSLCIPGVIRWIDGLDKVETLYPSAQLVEFIILMIFMLSYLIVAVVLFVKLIRAYICARNINLNGRKERLNYIIKLTSSAFFRVFQIMLLAALTGRQATTPAFIVSAALIIVYYLAVTVGKQIYRCYDCEQNKFYKKFFIFSTIKNIVLFFFCIALIHFGVQSCLQQIITNMHQVTHTSIQFSDPYFIIQNLFLVIACVPVFLSVETSCRTIHYGMTYDCQENSRNSYKKIAIHCKALIIIEALLFFINLVVLCVSPENTFSLSFFSLRSVCAPLFVSYLPLLLISVAGLFLILLPDMYAVPL